MINEDLVRRIVEKVVCEQSGSLIYGGCSSGSGESAGSTGICTDVTEYSVSCKQIPVETSARHVHLSQSDIEALFGRGHTLTKKKDISQPGQFACEERVTLIGPKGEIKNVSVLGPARKATQVEVSLTDSRILGINAPVSMSGDMRQAADIYIMTDKAVIKAEKALIAAKNHVHMTLADAEQFGVKDGESVRISVCTERPMTFDNVIVRANNDSKLAMHIDTDEANACCCKSGTFGIITKDCCLPQSCITPQRVKITENDVIDICKDKKLLTEEDAKKLSEKKAAKIRVGKRTIISPLAQDMLRSNRIEIEHIR